MSRAALARWLNLSVIAAVIAVLTLVLVSGPTRIALAEDICGHDDGTNVIPDPDMTIEWDEPRPILGPPGTWTGISVNWAYSAPVGADLIVVWRPNDPIQSTEVERVLIDDGGSSQGIDFNVPGNAVPGIHNVTVCWSDDGETWHALDPNVDQYLQFTVEDSSAPCYGELPDSGGADLTLLPDTGPYPSTFDATGSTIESFAGVFVQLIWDWVQPFELNPPLGTVIAQMPIPENNGGLITFDDVSVPAPPDGSVGQHNVGLCYFDGFNWFFVDMTELGSPTVFTVTAGVPDISTCSGGTPSTAHSLAYEVAPPTLHAGPPGTQDAAILSALGAEPSLDTWVYSLVWDVDTNDPFVLGQFPADGQSSHTFNFTVPYDATSGLHNIGVCFLFDNDGTLEWRPAGSTIQFNVQNPAPCGTVANIGDPNTQIGLAPSEGEIGSSFVASISTVEFGLDDALLVQVIWDWVAGNGDNIPPSGQVIAQITKADTTEQAAVTALVPTAAALGPHNVNICYYVPFEVGSFGVGPAESNFGEWIAGEPNVFNVVEGPTPTAEPSTPTPIPPTATQPPAPTSTPTPDVEPDVPTATFTPTAIPTSTPTVAATATPVIPPTIAIIGTSTAVVGPASGGTPPPGGTGGGPGGTGGGPGAPGGGTTINPNTGAQETTTPGSPTAAPSTPTVAPTGTPSSTTPTPSPSATQSPTDDVLGSRTQFVRSVPSFDELTDDFDVILTNVLLTGLFLILIFLTAEIFNQTIRDNQTDVESWMRNFFGPVIGIWGGLSAAMGAATLGSQKLRNLFWLAIVLVITVLIEGFLDPDFGLNHESLLLFFSLLVAVGLVTYLTEGGEAFVARGYGQDAAVRVFPAAIGIAMVCVIMSRLGGFIPGILYGFVGTAVFLRPSTLNQDQTGKMIFFPMALMLGLSVGAWLLVDQFRGPDASDFDIFIEGILIGIFIATIEGVAINMLPIAYMDGRKLIDWNPLVWFATAGVALFLLWTVLLNDQREYFDSLQETTSLVAIIAVVFTFGLSVVTWLWFRYRPGGHA